jgi:hypothetical protein
MPPAPLIATLPTVVPPTPKRTAKISTAGVTGMRKETNSAVATPNRAVDPLRMIAQGAIQGHLILTNKRIDAVALVPIYAK